MDDTYVVQRGCDRNTVIIDDYEASKLQIHEKIYGHQAHVRMKAFFTEQLLFKVNVFTLLLYVHI